MTDKGQKGNQHDISQIQLSFIFMLSSALDFFSPTFMNCGGKLNVQHLEKGRKAKECWLKSKGINWILSQKDIHISTEEESILPLSESEDERHQRNYWYL